MSAILAIERASFARDAYPESLFRLYAADRQALFLLAAWGDKTVGYIIAHRDHWGAEIVSIAVHPSWRGRGIGLALLAAVLSRLRRFKVQSVRLMVDVRNIRAREFYRRQGFRSIGRIPNYYEGGATAIRMRLKFDPKSSGQS